MLEWFVRCVDCGAVVESEVEAERQGWRFFQDELAQLEPRCGICSAEQR
jgi:transcription initiation factor TFIIIB Brf1 subunit/transcription initiation factor TFIIB